MQDKVFSLLGLATRAGKIVSGEFSVEKAVKAKTAKLVMVSVDASENTAKKFSDKCKFYNIPIRFYGTKEALGAAIGKELRSTAAVMDEGFANTILKRLEE
ncbi:L7Ae/L30e/S12e/Gadd45 family ribosomal protein [Lachnospiraceae bacterium C1.1]